MNRRVLLIEPDCKNKYPPLNLMKIARLNILADAVVDIDNFDFDKEE